MNQSAQDSTDLRVGPASYLTLHYRVTLMADPAAPADLVNTFTGTPATLQMGGGQLAPALEDRLLGLASGDYAVFDLAAGEAFGPRNPELVQRVARNALAGPDSTPEELEPGDLVQLSAPDGGSYTGVVKQLSDTSALLDFNHPLAGQPVRFEVRIVGVM